MLYMDLVRAVAAETGSTMKVTIPIVKATFDLIVKNVVDNDDEINIRNFGTFKKTIVKGHRVVHPRTKEESYVPAYSVLKFKGSRALKEKYDE